MYSSKSKYGNNKIYEICKKLREIIHEGSPEREYNIEYFGVENNLKNLILIIKNILDDLNKKYTQLINNPI